MLDKLNAKLAEVRTQKERALANLNCLIGAENVLLQMIQEESEVPKNEDSSN